MARIENDGIGRQAALFVVQNRNHKRILEKTVDHFAENVRALVAVKQRADHLNLQIRARMLKHHLVQMAQPVNDRRHVAVQIGEWMRQLIIVEHLHQRFVPAIANRIITAVRHRLRVNVLG